MGWYPGANSWEDKGDYQIKYKWSNGETTEILIARSGLSAKEADKEHIHVYKVGTSEQGTTFKCSDGRFNNISDNDVQKILNGQFPIF